MSNMDEYESPELRELGQVGDITGGLSLSGGDAEEGALPS